MYFFSEFKLKTYKKISNSAPRSTKPWITGNKLNCRGTMSPNSMETIFFGPITGNSAKCSGGPVSRLAQAKQVTTIFT